MYSHKKIETNTLIKVVKIKVVLIIAIYKLIAWTNSIYVRFYVDRMDLLRVMVVGKDGTPYQNELFFFDIHFPFQSPDGPPVSTLLQLYDLKLKLLNIFHIFLEFKLPSFLPFVILIFIWVWLWDALCQFTGDKNYIFVMESILIWLWYGILNLT